MYWCITTNDNPNSKTIKKMIKKYFIILLLLMTPIQSEVFSFLHIPIQEEGRIKPLDSFARNQLLKIYGKNKLTIYGDEQKYKISAIDWLFSVLQQDPSSLNQTIFKIENPDVVNALNLEINKKLIYSFNQINIGLNQENNKNLIKRLIQTDNEFLTLVEKQILDLNLKRELFIKLYNSASCIIPMITISDSSLAKAFNISPNKTISFSYYIRNQTQIHHNLQTIINSLKSEDSSNSILIELQKLMNIISIFENEIFMRNHSSAIRNSDILKIFPNDIEWISPWNIIEQIKKNGKLSESNNKLLLTLENIFDNDTNQKRNFSEYKNIIQNKTEIQPNILIREVNYSQSNLFLWSLIFYIMALTSLLVLSIFRLYSKQTNLIPIILIIIGFLYHLSGIIIRITILERPPVSTLYESIIFVGFVIVLFSIILEIIKKDHLSLFIGSIGGIILHYISFGYASDGDTLGVLVAVLNSNFWLATHVTTIAIGYGTTVMCSLIGHLYLIKAVFNPNNKSQLKTIFNNMIAMTFIALFFTMFGTILGGIWGDQSWGRFWGWDPKENGALLIVMWLLMMIHLRISKMVKAESYALGLVLANITVALAWFGVNLLNIGLHSYGFTDGAALNLFVFILFELFIGFSLYGIIKYKKYC